MLLLRFFPFSKLWVQIWLGLSLLVIIPIFSLGVLLINTSKEAIRTTLFRDHREIALRAAEEIQLFIQTPKKLLQTTAELIGISHTDIWKQETVLVELGLKFPIFSRISSVSLDGEEKASSEPGTDKKDFSKDSIVLQALQGHSAYSSVKISNEGIPFMEMAVPYTQLGKVAGALSAVVSLRGIWDILDHIQIGETGFVYAVAADGTIVAHKDKKIVLKNINLSGDLPVKQALQGESGSVMRVLDNGQKVLTAFAPVKELSWGLITEQDWKEAFSFAKVMTRQSIFIIVISLFLSVLLSVILALLISRPVNQLSVTANKVAQGDFNVQIKTQRKDEIGLLIKNFIYMIQQLKKAKELERITAMGMASASIAHELRGPLVAIKTYTQLFSRRRQEVAFLDRFEKTIPKEIDRLEEMLEEMTDFARRQKLERSYLSLETILDEVLMLMKEQISHHTLNRIVDSKDPIVIWADKQKLKQVLINLISNALAAMDHEGCLGLRLTQKGAYACLAISDTGKGISEEELSKVFEPFHTTRQKGLGLGLAISKHIVDLHHGKLEVTSKINAGTIFSLSFPLAKKSVN